MEFTYDIVPQHEEFGYLSFHSYFEDKNKFQCDTAKMKKILFETKNFTFRVSITAAFYTSVTLFEDLNLSKECNQNLQKDIVCIQQQNKTTYKLPLINHNLQLNADSVNGLPLFDELTLIIPYMKDNIKVYKWITDTPGDPSGSYPWLISSDDIANRLGYLI